MEQKIVEKGEKYWCVGEDMNPLEAVYGENWALDVLRLEAGNCYTDYHECYVMCGKLRAVLAGADVIQMPSEDEIWKEANARYPRRWSGDRENGEKFDAF